MSAVRRRGEVEEEVGRTGLPLDGAIELTRVSKSFAIARRAEVIAVQDLDLCVTEGEFVALIGPSGCGKSTVLRLVAGLERPTAGTVKVKGAEPATLIARHGLGVAFQDHALLPWLTVSQNLALPFRVARRKPDEAHIQSLIEMVGLTGFERARPKQLSGGMRQRVAIARALVLQPELLLLDEPFASVDAVTRRRLNVELQRIWVDAKVTTLLITHSVDEAVFLADRVVVMTGRPGCVRITADIPFSRPRTRELLVTPEFHELTDMLIEALDAAESGG